MQNTKIANFARQAQLLVPDTATRRIVMPTVVGIALGSFLTVAQGGELHPNTSYMDNHVANVGRAASYVNENMYIDINVALEAARNMYMLRWRIVNGKPSEYSVNPEYDWLATAIGIAPLVPLEVYEALKSTGLSAAELLTKARMLIDALKTEGLIAL